MDARTCVVLAGPNGAGKTTLFHTTNPPGSGRFVNADDIARAISPGNPEASTFEAGRQAIRLLRQLMHARESFVYETTLSSHQALNVMRDARAVGYQVELVFVALRSVELHVKRVATRVAQGGHDIPEHVIRRRYDLSLRNLQTVASLADQIAVYDNSSEQGARLLVVVRDRRIVVDRLDLRKRFDRNISALVTAGISSAGSAT